MKHLCPVCGYPELEEPAKRFSICPSCGTEFGNDDFVIDPNDRRCRLAELRARWLAAGAPWFDDDTPKPKDWQPYNQVAREGVGLVVTSTDARTELKKALQWAPAWNLVPVEMRGVA